MFYNREMWVHDLILHGSDKSEFLLAEEILESPDEEKCHQYFRMQKYQFEYLLNKVESLISKKDTFWRSAIPAKRRLILTIRLVLYNMKYHLNSCSNNSSIIISVSTGYYNKIIHISVDMT